MSRALFLTSVIAAVFSAWTPREARAQSPELLMRELASGQIKKGMRSIGFGGDGATWGNYSLVYRDAGTALLDYGYTGYTDGNAFSFTAVGATSPAFWHGIAVYLIGMSEGGSGLDFSLHSPGLGPGSTDVRGTAANRALFCKIAMPLANGFSAGIMLAYEISSFDGLPSDGSAGFVNYQTSWLPSGGFGVTWQPDPRWLVGVRAILNHDWEVRTDPAGTSQGLARSYEGRIGGSFAPWPDTLLDLGGTVLDKANAIAGTHGTIFGPNVGVEQALFDRHFTVRAGLDEASLGAGFSVRFSPLTLDVAYVHDLAISRTGTVFGAKSNSVLATLAVNYRALEAMASSTP